MMSSTIGSWIVSSIRILTLSGISCAACGIGCLIADERSDRYYEWLKARNEVHYAQKTPEELMRFLPEAFREAHARSVALDREWYESVWELGQPEFFVACADTLTHDGDTLIAVLFSDDRLSQVVGLRVSAGQKSIFPSDTAPFVAGSISGFTAGTPDIDLDGRPDIAVVHLGGAHSSVLRLYLWKAEALELVAYFVSDVGLHELTDVDGDGTVEVVVGHRPGPGDAIGSLPKEVFRLSGNRFVKSDSLTELLMQEEASSEEKRID